MARAVRAQLVILFNWHEAKHTVGKDYRNPIPKLLKSDPLKTALVRERHLDDDEIKALWLACGDMGAYGAAVQSALLTGQRWNKVLRMRRADLKDQLRVNGESVANVWDPTRTDDPKNKGVGIVPLSAMAREVIAAVPIIDADGDADFVFSVNGRAALVGVSKWKRRLDQKMLTLLRRWAADRGEDPDQVELKPWQQRDLRRTARTLMARAKVPAEVAEHCLAHVLPGIQGVYNRHSYLPKSAKRSRSWPRWSRPSPTRDRPPTSSPSVAAAAVERADPVDRSGPSPRGVADPGAARPDFPSGPAGISGMISSEFSRDTQK
jgi:integrase